MIQADIKLPNIMLGLEDESVLIEYEEAESINPVRRKVLDPERTIYASRSLQCPRDNAYGLPVLCDFGEARFGSTQEGANIQPEMYKAPEVLM